MSKTETQQQQSMDNVPLPGYPTVNSPEGVMKKKKIFRIKKRGEQDRFIRGCLFVLRCVVCCDPDEDCCY